MISVTGLDKYQQTNINSIEKISESLIKIIERSKNENRELENLVASVQQKSQYYQMIINHLHQIDILGQ